MKFSIIPHMPRFNCLRFGPFVWSQHPALKGFLQTTMVGLIVIVVARYATSQSVLPTTMNQDELVSKCHSQFCEPASALISSIANFLAAVSLSIIGAFIFLMKTKSHLSGPLRLGICISGITLALVAILVYYILTVDLSVQLFLGEMKLNIINDRLIWEAGFLFVATLVLVFVALTTNWDISDAEDN